MAQIQDRVSTRKAEFPSFPSHEAALRAALSWLCARYDDGAVTPAVFCVIKMLETELSWLAHRGGVSS